MPIIWRNEKRKAAKPKEQLYTRGGRAANAQLWDERSAAHSEGEAGARAQAKSEAQKGEVVGLPPTNVGVVKMICSPEGHFWLAVVLISVAVTIYFLKRK